MANHKSALKRIRSSNVKRLRNKYYAKSTRSAIRGLRSESDKSKAETQLKSVKSQLDKLVKRNIIHKNNAANVKSKLEKHVNSLA